MLDIYLWLGLMAGNYLICLHKDLYGNEYIATGPFKGEYSTLFQDHNTEWGYYMRPCKNT